MDYPHLDTLLVVLSSTVLISSTLTSAAAAAASNDGCPSGLPFTSQMALFRGTCFQFVSQEKFWHQARDHCLRNGGRLVKINDPQTNEFIVETLNGLWWRNNGVWIGLHDSVSEMRWQWTGVELYQNDPVRWTNWGRGHPGAFLHSHRDCVRMVRNDNWKWHETFCNTLQWQYRFICEYNASNPGGAIAAKERRLLRGQSSLRRQPAVETGNMAEGFEGESISSDSDPEAAAIHSDEETGSNAAGHKQSAVVVVSIVCLLAGTVSLIVLFIFCRRRRRRNMEREYPGESNCVVRGSKGKKFDDVTTEANSFRPTAVSNVYVEADVIRGHVTTRLAEKRADDDSSDEETDVDRSTKKREMIDSLTESADGEFDAAAQSANIYAEITEGNEDLSPEDHLHIYEALEDVREKVAALT